MNRLPALLFVALGGCASAVGAAPAPSAPRLTENQVASSVTVDVHAPLAKVYAYVIREDTPARDLRGYGLISGVRGDVRLTSGGWDHPGARRIVQFEDDTTLRESIELLDPAGHFRYRVSDLSSSFGAFVTEGRGYWDFVPTSEDRTRVTWTYVFTAKSCEARPFVRTAVSAFFHPYMEQGIRSIRAHVEHGG